jgi:pyruvate dehydrogenase E1 component
VTVSTNLGPWVNRRGIFYRAERADTFREEKVVSAQRWAMSPQGQHIELGIAESNLFLLLAALALPGRSLARACCRWARSTTRSSSGGTTR